MALVFATGVVRSRVQPGAITSVVVTMVGAIRRVFYFYVSHTLRATEGLQAVGEFLIMA